MNEEAKASPHTKSAGVLMAGTIHHCCEHITRKSFIVIIKVLNGSVARFLSRYFLDCPYHVSSAASARAAAAAVVGGVLPAATAAATLLARCVDVVQ